MIATDRFDKVEITDAGQLRDWLQTHHQSEESVWLVTFKKEAGPGKYVSRFDVLDELAAFGWIDGIRRKLDNERTMQLISKRKQQKWAKSYRDRADKLIANGRMQPPGFASIDEAKLNGTYKTLEDVDALKVPEDLSSALKAQASASKYFTDCPPSYQRNIFRWLASAKKPETRSGRIEKIVAACAMQERIPNY